MLKDSKIFQNYANSPEISTHFENCPYNRRKLHQNVPRILKNCANFAKLFTMHKKKTVSSAKHMLVLDLVSGQPGEVIVVLIYTFLSVMRQCSLALVLW